MRRLIHLMLSPSCRLARLMVGEKRVACDPVLAEDFKQSMPVFVDMDGDVVKDVSFQGAGCAISTASASMMTESVKGRTRAEAESLFERFHDLIVGKGGESPDLGKLAVFSGVREYPVRVKCATLPWHTLKAALAENGATVSTESEGPNAESGGA